MLPDLWEHSLNKSKLQGGISYAKEEIIGKKNVARKTALPAVIPALGMVDRIQVRTHGRSADRIP